jgi:hypothetical protein
VLLLPLHRVAGPQRAVQHALGQGLWCQQQQECQGHQGVWLQRVRVHCNGSCKDADNDDGGDGSTLESSGGYSDEGDTSDDGSDAWLTWITRAVIEYGLCKLSNYTTSLVGVGVRRAFRRDDKEGEPRIHEPTGLWLFSVVCGNMKPACRRRPDRD